MKSNSNNEPPFYIRWENRVTRRYYVVYFARDLLGWNLLTVWGGINRRNGHHRNLACKTLAEGIQQSKPLPKKENNAVIIVCVAIVLGCCIIVIMKINVL